MLSEKQLKKLEIQDWSRLTKDFNKADLLLGNGFSLNITGHLAYRSLFEEFLNRCGENECKIFKSFKTSNFERIQEILIDAKRVNQLFKIATKDNRINKAIDLLKEGLIQSIQKNHPNFSQLDLKQLHSLSIQLNDYGDIFTLNYDLFLYHTIMLMKDESDKNNVPAPYSDYFWGGKPEEQFKHFMDYDTYHPKHLYYLHGALFLFSNPPDTLKLKRSQDSKELVAMIGDVINGGTMPLFVSEGNYKEKLKTIERSNYLSFCYENLEHSENNLVIFGSSMSAQDTHIVNAINYKRNKRRLAIAVHIGDKSKNDLEKEVQSLREKFKNHKISFFNSETIFNFGLQ